jgi:hypothetical protein
LAHLFLSHSSADDGFVRELRQALADLGQEVWIDSRQLKGGDPLWSEIQAAIEKASGLAVLVSPDAFQSDWVAKELKHGLKMQAERGRAVFPVILLALNGTKPGSLAGYFDEEPTYIPVSSAPGGATAAINDILVALGLRLPADRPPVVQPRPEPVEELVLELSNLRFLEEDGKRRAAGTALWPQAQEAPHLPPPAPRSAAPLRRLRCDPGRLPGYPGPSSRPSKPKPATPPSRR